jgi:hypothetical protein
MTPKEVAEYMLAQQGDKKWLDQEVIVGKIRKDCGVEHTYTNPNGNWAISKAVLNEWRKLTADTHVWERGDRAWRLRTDRDPPGKRQTD